MFMVYGLGFMVYGLWFRVMVQGRDMQPPLRPGPSCPLLPRLDACLPLVPPPPLWRARPRHAVAVAADVLA